MQKNKFLKTGLFLLLAVSTLLAQQSNDIKIKNVEQVNTPALDFSPVFYHHGLVYVSSERRHGKMDKAIKENAFDLNYADLGPKGKLSKPGPLSLKVNTRYHEGPVSFSADMQKMYFTRSNVKNGEPVKDKKGIIRLKIYEAQRGNDDWTNIKELPFNDDQFSCVHPALSSDGQTLYFASDRPGGEGGMDLYYVKRLGENWSAPVNMGVEVNTEDHDVFPYIHPSGKLFFSSNRPGGMGGLDIYAMNTSADKKNKLEKLPAPINSAKDDLGLILSLSGEVGYMSSDRPGGKGKDDIYRLDIPGGMKGLFPPKDFPQVVKVFNKETSAALTGAKVVAIEIEEGRTIFEMNEVFEIDLVKNKVSENLLRYTVRELLFENMKTVMTDANGKATIQLTKSKRYVIVAQKEGFKANHISHSTLDADDAKMVSIGLWPVPKVIVEEKPPVLEIGSIIVLDQIFYDFGKSYIRTDASKGLDAILNLMKEYPGMTVDLTAHTDSRGSKDFNLDLSARRAGSAKYYLTSRGIEESRIKAFGKGEQVPRNRCIDGVTCTEEEYQHNRRTEIVITSLGKDVKNIKYIDNEPEYIDRAKIKKAKK